MKQRDPFNQGYLGVEDMMMDMAEIADAMNLEWDPVDDQNSSVLAIAEDGCGRWVGLVRTQAEEPWTLRWTTYDEMLVMAACMTDDYYDAIDMLENFADEDIICSSYGLGTYNAGHGIYDLATRITGIAFAE